MRVILVLVIIIVVIHLPRIYVEVKSRLVEKELEHGEDEYQDRKSSDQQRIFSWGIFKMQNGEWEEFKSRFRHNVLELYRNDLSTKIDHLDDNPALKDIETAVFALESEVDFPPCPGNTVMYHDTVLLGSNHADYVSEEPSTTISAVYSAKFTEDIAYGSECEILPGTNPARGSLQRPYPLWHNERNFSDNPPSETMYMKYGKPFIIANKKWEGFILASDLPEIFDTKASKSVEQTLLAHESPWNWYMIREMPTFNSSMIPMSLENENGDPLLYSDEFYLINAATDQLIGIMNGTMINLEVMISPADWLLESRGLLKRKIDAVQEDIQTRFTFRPNKDTTVTYCDSSDNLCKRAPIEDVEKNGTINNMICYRSDYCWGLCSMPKKIPPDSSDSNKYAISISHTPTRTPTQTTASVDYHAGSVNIFIIGIASVIGILLVAGILILTLRKLRRS